MTILSNNFNLHRGKYQSSHFIQKFQSFEHTLQKCMLIAQQNLIIMVNIITKRNDNVYTILIETLHFKHC